MPVSHYELIPLFTRFINDSYKGKRLKPDGSKIRPQTVSNYEYVLRYLKEFETDLGIVLRIIPTKGNMRLFIREKQYWNKFYRDFTTFLHIKKKCFDNYVGSVIKILRIFFNYLNIEAGIVTGNFYKKFYVCKEEIPIVTLMPEQLNFLINDASFEQQLAKPLQKSKAIFVFGSTVALRISDLFNIKFTDIVKAGESYYLPVKTIKTGTYVQIKLPVYAMDIVNRFKLTARKRKTIFPPVPLSRFNNHLKLIAAKAGWTHVLRKHRSRKGELHEIECSTTHKEYRFCDLVSSHTMRRTAITTMLMLGMKEHVVRSISGHASDSKSFYRYVNLVQSHLDNEMDLVFNKLANVS